MAKRKAKTPEPVKKLDLLAAEPFSTRAAVRAFVAGDEYQMLADLVSCGCDSGELELPQPLAKLAHEAASFLSDDLAKLAKLAAQSDEEPFVTPVPGKGLLFSLRAKWLGALAVAFDIADATHAEEAARVLAAQFDAIEREELEAWRKTTPKKPRRGAA